jgi:hypothetical protein
MSANGHEHPDIQPRPGYVEDESGTTMDSGAALCHFSPTKGGLLDRWQWRAVPPQEAIQPASMRGPHPPIELVDPVRGALIDHFMPLGTKPEEVAANTHREYGDFVEGAYRSQTVDSGGELRIGLLRDGEIKAGKRVAEVRLAKSAALRPGAADLSVLYRVINSSLRPLQILFAVEFNLYAPGLSTTKGNGYYLIDGLQPEDDAALGSAGVSPDATHVALVNPDGEMALQLGWDREADLWRLPGAGGSTSVRLLSVWRIQLPPRDNWAMGLWFAPA